MGGWKITPAEIIIANTIKDLKCSSFSKCFTCITLVNPSIKSMTYLVFLSPFYTWEDWDAENHRLQVV